MLGRFSVQVSLVGAGLVVVLFSFVRATNFTGFDEWVYLSLVSRGIVSFPQSNRPLQLVWDLPAVALNPHGFSGFFAVHVVYLALAAALVALLVRRLAPESPALALLAGAVAATWAPLDMARLATVQASMNSGATFTTLFAIWLLVESERSRRPAVLAFAIIVAVGTARGYEAVLGLLAGAPLLLLLRPAPPGRWRWGSIVAWEGGVLAALALAAFPLLGRAGASSYQREVLGLDLAPTHLAERLLLQLRLHLQPLVPENPRELLHVAVPLLVGLFLAGAWWASRAFTRWELPTPRRLGLLSGVGLAFAVLGYAPFIVSASVHNATRMQFLSGFGIAVLLVAVIGLVASWVPARRQALVLVGAGAWVVAVGTGHTMGMQAAWNTASYYPAQSATLTDLTALAPGLKPGTLVLLVDDAAAWPVSFGFRHAVEYLYGEGVTGHVAGVDDLLYSARATPEGIVTVPAPVIRGPWRCGPELHRWDQILAVRLGPDRRLTLMEDWDSRRLAARPAGARYDPRGLIVHPERRRPERDVLGPSS